MRYSKLRRKLNAAEERARETELVNNSIMCVVEDYQRDMPVLQARAEKAEAEVAQLRKERDWLAVELGNALIDPCLVEHLRDLGGMSPPDPKTLREAARKAVDTGGGA